MKKVPYDLIGNIAIFNFRQKQLLFLKKIWARKFLKKNKYVTTVLEKTDDVKGKLRIAPVKYLAGIKTFETIYKENGCLFKFDVSKTYFSPRLSNERNRISEDVLKLSKKIKNPKILVMFAGIFPYPIVIARKLKLNKIKAKIYSNELNEKANIYGEKNIKLNKLEEYIEIANGDCKNLPEKLKQKFDIILMPRPNLNDTFLETALKMSKKGTTIFYHGFGKENEVIEEIKRDTKGKIGKINIRKAGDIAPHKYRWQAVFKVR